MAEDSNFNFIEIIKEDRISPYRFQPNPAAPRVPIRNQKNHGGKLKKDIDIAKKTVFKARERAGIDAKNLIIIKFSSKNMSPKILENLISKFNVSLVEEIQVKNDLQILLQFHDEKTISLFEHERLLFESESKDTYILTYAQRRDIFSCIEEIRNVTREDRMGPRLREFLKNKDNFEEEFYVDIDLWHDGDNSRIIQIEGMIRKALGTVGGKLVADFFVTPSLLLGRIRVNEIGLNALLEQDIVANIDLPLGLVLEELCDLLQPDFKLKFRNNLDESAPLATILDSGVFSGHPLLKEVIVGENDFDLTENGVYDNHGHGTSIAGTVVYGDIAKQSETEAFYPLVRICSGKIMHKSGDKCSFPVAKRPEQIVSEAIKYFVNEYKCRVFNLSAGDDRHLYFGGRQMSWAETLDNLARKLDIVIVISAGNVSNPDIPEFKSREELMEKARNQLFDPQHRLIDPSTASLCISVGSIARRDEPEVIHPRTLRIAPSPHNGPSVFTRIGKGVNKSIKPEFVEYGGNFAVHQITRGDTRWFTTDRQLSEIVLGNTNDKLFRFSCGTSFSAPRITHYAARIEKELQRQLGYTPSSNLIRAMLVNSAYVSREMKNWTEESVDCHYDGETNPKQERRMRLIGFGKFEDRILYKSHNQATLIAEDSLELRNFHLYKIPIPQDFALAKHNKRISISLAYNPVTRLSRKEYLANSLWFEVYRRIDEEELLLFKKKKEEGVDEELPNMKKQYIADFSPGRIILKTSTLQQRVWEKGPRGGSNILGDPEKPFIYILVTGKEQFKYDTLEQPQDYSLVITYTYDSEKDINLHNSLRENVRQKIREVERVRGKVRG